MSDAGGRAGALRIGRMNCTCLVPREHPDPERLRWRADGIARGRLAPTLAHWLDSTLDRADPAVWRIRRLDVELAFDPSSLTDDSLGRTWSQRVLAQIGRALATGDDGVNVLRYDDRADFVAHFVLDLACGTAWQQWQYRAFDSLRSLPDGVAVSEALAREPAHTASVLRRLDAWNSLEVILGALSARGAATVQDTLLVQSPAGGAASPILFEALLGAWPDSGVRSPLDTAHNVLRLWSAFRRVHGERSDGDVLLAADALVGLAAVLWTPAGALRNALDNALAVADQARQDGDDLRAQTVQVLIDADRRAPGWLERAVTPVAPQAAPVQPANAQTVRSPFIGAFALLPTLTAMGFDAIVNAAAADVPDLAERTALAQGLRLTVLIKALGSARAAEARWDAAVLAAAGADPTPASRPLPSLRHVQIEAGYAAWQSQPVSPAPAPEEELNALSLADWMNTTTGDRVETDAFTSALARTALALFARRLVGFERSSARYIQANFLEGAGSATIGADDVKAQLPACPLIMILRLTGLDHTVVDVPWLRPGRLRLVVDD
ncbi:MAG: hypothetical protein HZB53_06270 [Chloroflexi bacterium]|nr:hypothetical protein [Chloroflexota bacterium]